MQIDAQVVSCTLIFVCKRRSQWKTRNKEKNLINILDLQSSLNAQHRMMAVRVTVEGRQELCVSALSVMQRWEYLYFGYTAFGPETFWAGNNNNRSSNNTIVSAAGTYTRPHAAKAILTLMSPSSNSSFTFSSSSYCYLVALLIVLYAYFAYNVCALDWRIIFYAYTTANWLFVLFFTRNENQCIFRLSNLPKLPQVAYTDNSRNNWNWSVTGKRRHNYEPT